MVPGLNSGLEFRPQQQTLLLSGRRPRGLRQGRSNTQQHHRRNDMSCICMATSLWALTAQVSGSWGTSALAPLHPSSTPTARVRLPGPFKSIVKQPRGPGPESMSRLRGSCNWWLCRVFHRTFLGPSLFWFRTDGAIRTSSLALTDPELSPAKP